MITKGIKTFKGRRVLLLQGPVGPFFKRFSLELERVGCEVFKINFNGGDFAFYAFESNQFSGDIDQWPAYLEHFLDENCIDLIFLFGDCRPIHKEAKVIANKRDVEVCVFEEGYIRPDFVTLECDGVNGNSSLPRESVFYKSFADTDLPNSLAVGNAYWQMVIWAIVYYVCATLLFPIYKLKLHHRPLTILEALPWLKSMWRRVVYQITEHGVQEQLVNDLHKKFFLVPLQVHNDPQILEHSPYKSVGDFICEVMKSFSENSSSDTYLVLKHHPMDRGYNDYTKLIENLSVEYQISRRIFYVHDLHLPSLLDSALGVVVVNSTVGLSAIQRFIPVKVCGKSVYDVEEMTYQKDLSSFWRSVTSFSPNKQIVKGFINYLIQKTQLNGSFYKGKIEFGYSGNFKVIKFTRALSKPIDRQLPQGEVR